MGREKHSIWSLTASLTIIWALTILYGEMFAFWMPSCSWPHSSHPIEGLNNSSGYTKVAVVADPQLMDATSIALAPKSLALEIVQFYTDLFMRRAFLSSVLPLKPDVILFLGDYFDGGYFLSDDDYQTWGVELPGRAYLQYKTHFFGPHLGFQSKFPSVVDVGWRWQESLSRLKHIFDLNVLQQATNVKVHFLVGNHDIGYAHVHSQLPEVVRRYEKEFGERNYKFTVGKVDFIAIDAQTLDGKPQGPMTSDTWNFVFNVSKDSSSAPRILLTHIPLFRPDSTSCGPHRSSPIINQRISHSTDSQQISYQDYITRSSSTNLLNLIKPALVLSGHDHDQCTTTHISKFGSVKEHTVGTISWQQGNLYPSFMLLSVSNHDVPAGSELEDVISTQLCFLPVQTFIYLWYLFLFIMTLVLVLFWPSKGMPFFGYVSQFKEYGKSIINGSIFGGVTKEKNDDEDCEYEMIWDAEGTMHLVKQASKAPSRSSNERIPEERGNAVFRSTARRQSGQETDGSVPSDVNIHVGLDSAENVALRKSKSKTKRVVRRLVRTVRVFCVIAAVNVPLYMMLLFKDWIDK